MADTLTLFTDGLLSKWGFNDGDMPDEVCDALDDMFQVWPIITTWHTVLKQLVLEYVVPALDQPVELVVIETSHNPIRASKLHGHDVEDYWYSGPYDGKSFLLSPEYVEIPMQRVIELLLEGNDCPQRMISA